VTPWETIISVRGPILTILVKVSEIMKEKDHSIQHFHKL
jgi:hypothetical protein